MLSANGGKRKTMSNKLEEELQLGLGKNGLTDLRELLLSKKNVVLAAMTAILLHNQSEPGVNSARRSLERAKSFLGLTPNSEILDAISTIIANPHLPEAAKTYLGVAANLTRTECGDEPMSRYDWFLLLSVLPDLPKEGIYHLLDKLGIMNKPLYTAIMGRVAVERGRATIGDNTSSLIGMVEIVPDKTFSAFATVNILLRGSDGNFAQPMKLYTYQRVPIALAAGLVASESAGVFFNSYVKGQYNFQ